MNHPLKRLLESLEDDMKSEIGASFSALAAKYFSDSASTMRPVSTRLPPEKLSARFSDGFPAAPMPVADVIEKLRRDVVEQSNWLYHPRYMGHQVSAPLPAAVWSEPIISALNNSVAVQEMSPAMTMVEMQLIRWLSGLVGYDAAAGGTLTSGGTEANFTALMAARARAMPDSWENGVAGDLPVIVCGEHTHYAVTRAAAQLGLGMKRVVVVQSRDFRMDEEDLTVKLEALAREGTRVMAVVATAGSTATGSFDDLSAIGDICDAHDIWFHVDGAHGASALLSPTRQNLVRGIEKARSIAWDPHKMMFMPLSAGVLLIRDERDLDAAFRQRAPYLFHDGENERSWDQGGRSFQCSRRADALKLWVALHRYGTEAFGLLLDHLCDLARALYDILAAHPSFEVLHEPACNILCFRHRGSDELNLELRNAYNTSGTGWITTTVLGGRRVLRTTLMNPRTTHQDLEQMVAELTRMV